MASEKLTMSKRLEGFGNNVWTEFGKLAADYQALHLGQGFPDFFPPDHVRQSLKQAAQATSPSEYCYARPYGHPRLVKALADLYSPIFGHLIDPYKEILVTLGAIGSLYCVTQAFINPGDEVIIIEPYFTAYMPMVLAAGGIPVFVPLRPAKPNPTSSADFTFDTEELSSKFNSKTKALIFNTPNNPLGKIYTQEETELLANLCKQHDVIVFADEVYEWLVYPSNQHVKIANLPDMWERTLSIGSASKSFSATGWRSGWTIGPEQLMKACQIMHEMSTYACPTPIQKALSICFEREIAIFNQPECYFQSLAMELLPKRDYIADVLRTAGLEPIIPQGGYFIMADFTKLGIEYEDGSDDPKDYKFVRWLTKEKKLAAIPLSAFYCKEHKHLGENYARFCFIKVVMESKRLAMAKRLEGYGDNMWTEFGKLAADYEAVHLGQGFPDFFPPDHVRQALKQAAEASTPSEYCYTRPCGHPRLVKVLADLYSPIFGRQIDPYEEILINVGAIGSLYGVIQAFINPGDEVIIIEPYFTCYMPMVLAAGGKPVFVPLRPAKPNLTSSADFTFDTEELSRKFNNNTKALIFNTPNNPLGKIYTHEETEVFADLCKQHDVIVIADEVYEWLVYPPNQHIKIANLPGMWERTLTIGSASKSFCATGWRCGWTIGPKYLINACQIMHGVSTYACPTPIQKALSICFEREIAIFNQPECYFQSLAMELLPKRDYLADVLRTAGLEPIIPQGGYFVMTDFTKLDIEYEDGSDDPKDYKFVRWLTKEKKLAAIPLSAFYSKEHKHLGENYARFCFIKEDSTLQKAAQIIESLK